DTAPVAIVTGAARGIGAAVANAVAAQGFAVAICDVDAAATATAAAEIATAHDVPAIGVRVDIASSASVAASVAHIEATLGPITALVNNAGIDVIKPFVDSTEDEWDRIIAVNLRGTIGVCRAVLDGMIERKHGRIV